MKLFHFHRWSSWEKAEEGQLMRRGLRVGFRVVQRRTCAVCGKIQFNKQDIY